MKYILNGDEWSLTGWFKNQWRSVACMELNLAHTPAIAQMPAKVPGAIQNDLLNAGYTDNPFYGSKSLNSEWINNREWFLERFFLIPKEFDGDKYELVFEGLDYHGEICLNGIKLKEFYGMFETHTIDVTGFLKLGEENHLRIIFLQTPEVDGQYGFTSKIDIIKSRFNYIWDWCPRMIPVGIWDDVYIRTYKIAKIENFFPKTFSNGTIKLQYVINSLQKDEFKMVVTVFKGNEKVDVITYPFNLLATEQKFDFSINIDDATLWYPNGYGKQQLYTIKTELFNKNNMLCDVTEKSVGFAEIEFDYNEDSPKGAMEYTAKVNGKKVFLKGVNWVPISPYYGTVTKEQYKAYLTRFKDMNCNVLRVWGGGILEKQDFYDICDEFGLMVWQEFPQSSSGIDNTPSNDPNYLKILEQTAVHYITKRRHHISHIIWCGGNELMWENFTPVNENHMNIKLLKELTEEYDNYKKFLPCSASGPNFTADTNFNEGVHHDVHGPWVFQGPNAHYDYYNMDDSLFRSEAGCAGISRLSTLEKYKDNFKIWPPDKSNPYWVHRGAWWICLKEMTEWFGDFNEDGSEIDRYVSLNRFIQAEALRYAAEATIRRFNKSSGFIVWMGNEPFPNNANTSVIECDGATKPAYYKLKSAFSNTHCSLKYNKLFYRENEEFFAEIFSHNFTDKKDVVITASVFDITGKCILTKEKTIVHTKEIENAFNLSFTVKDFKDNVFFVYLNESENENIYVFSVANQEPYLAPLKLLRKASVEIKGIDNDTFTIKNIDHIAAINIHLIDENEPLNLIVPNGFTLFPDESKIIKINRIEGSTGESKISIEKLN